MASSLTVRHPPCGGRAALAASKRSHTKMSVLQRKQTSREKIILALAKHELSTTTSCECARNTACVVSENLEKQLTVQTTSAAFASDVCVTMQPPLPQLDAHFSRKPEIARPFSRNVVLHWHSGCSYRRVFHLHVELCFIVCVTSETGASVEIIVQRTAVRRTSHLNQAFLTVSLCLVQT